jgi:6-phosphogluconolactonase (cycloisomerase 2 family)
MPHRRRILVEPLEDRRMLSVVDPLGSSAAEFDVDLALAPSGAQAFSATGMEGTGRLTYLETLKDGVEGVDGLDEAAGVAVSPDGSHIYVASFRDSAVAVFDRNAASGRANLLQVLKDNVDGVDGLWGAQSVVVSPDGDHVYVASCYDSALAVFQRDPIEGTLTYVERHADGLGGVDGLSGALAVAISFDGAHIYSAGIMDDAVAVFSRDNSTGRLTFRQVVRDGVDGVDGLYEPFSLAVSPDDNHVYVTGGMDDALVAFQRDPATGELTFVEMEKDGVAGVDGLDGALGVAVSPDGEHVYVAAAYDDAIAVFSRDAATGALAYVQAYRGDPCPVLDFSIGIAVSPDGNQVYTTNKFYDILGVFDRDASTGRVTYVEHFQNGVDGVHGLSEAWFVTVSPDGRNVYAVGATDDALVVFSRDVGQPTVSGLTPAAGATGVDLDTNLEMIFSEDIQKAAGSIFLRRSSDDSLVEAIDVTSAAVSVTGAAVTIDLTQDLEESTGYYVEVTAGAFEDLTGSAYVGIVGGEEWSFLTGDFTAPIISSLSPSNGAADVAVDPVLTATFSEEVQKAAGNVVLKMSSDDTVVEMIDVTSPRVAVSGAVATITLSVTLAENTGYYVEVALGAFEDPAGNDFAGISGSTVWNFTTGDFTAPTVSTVSPADNATGVVQDPDLVITFSENMQKAAGSIVLKKSSDDAVVESIDVSSSQVTVSGAVATIDPSVTFSQNTGYYVEVAPGAFEDLSGKDFAGIAGPTAWNFMTGDFAPLVAQLVPADNATSVALRPDLMMTFNEEVANGVGAMVLRKSSDGTVVEQINVPSAAVTIMGATATIDLASTLELNTGYYVEMTPGSFQDLTGNNCAGLSGAAAWNFTTTDVLPLVVVGTSPELAGTLPPVSSLEVTFNQPIDPATFDARDVGLLNLKNLAVSSSDFLGGSFVDCVVEGSLLYAATNTGLHILDISDPSAVTRLGGYDMSGYAYGVQVEGGIAYVARDSEGLVILDVSDPAGVRRLGGYDTPGSASGVQVVGNVAYVADRASGLQILDVSDPAAVTLLGSYDTPADACQVCIVGSVAYVADIATLEILNISDPGSVVRLGGFSTPGSVYDVQVLGNVAYVADYDAGLQILDVSDAAAVTQLGGYDTPGTARAVQVVGSVAYVSDWMAGLQILDVSDPGAVTHLGSYATHGATRGIHVLGTVAYVTDIGLQILDVSDPAAVTRAGGYVLPNDSYDIQMIGNVAYVADGYGDLTILDVADLNAVKSLGSYNTPGSARDVQVLDSIAYVAGYSGGLQILDVSDPSAITSLGSYGTSSYSYAVQVAGNLAYVADYSDGLQILDVSNPAAVTRLGGYNTPGRAYGVEVVGNVAYVADDGAGLQILDVSDPAAVTLLGVYNTPGYACDVRVVGSVAYVADGPAGLQILDVSDPANVIRLGGSTLSSHAHKVQVVGNLAYVADGWGGVHILDVSHPVAVTRLAEFDTVDAYGIQVLGGTIYVADRSNGLTILELDSPATSISHVAGNTYRVDFGSVVPDGAYALQLGPGIQTPGGLAMDQDQDGRAGESPDDVYFARLRVSAGPSVVSLVPTDDATNTAPDTDLVITFSEDVRKGTGDIVIRRSADAFTMETIDVASAAVAVAGATATIARTAGLAENTDYYVEIGQGVFESLAGTDFIGIEPFEEWNFRTGDYAPLLARLAPESGATRVALGTNLMMTFNEIVEKGLGTILVRKMSDNSIVEAIDVASAAVTLAGMTATIDPATLLEPDTGYYVEAMPETFRDPTGKDFAGFFGTTRWNFTTSNVLPLRVTGTSPVLTRTQPLSSLDVTFNQPIDPASFSEQDVALLDLDNLNVSSLGFFGGTFYACVLEGSLLYAATSAGLHILDVSDPAAVTRVGGYATLGDARDVQVAGAVAYVANNDAGLLILDVSNPAAVTRLGGYDTAGAAYGVQVVGSVAYVADYSRGLQILDVSNPGTVARLGQYDTTGLARSVHVVGNVAYVADDGAGLQILDVSNPGVVTRLGGYDTSGTAYGVQVVGSVAYVADGLAGLQILDITNPDAVTRMGGYDTSGHSYDVQVAGSVAYVADDYYGLQILDVSNPGAVARLGQHNTSDAYGVQVTGGVAYLADGTGGLRILDVSIPNAPASLGAYDRIYARQVQVVGSVAYVAYYGLHIYDVSNPGVVTRLGGYDTSGTAYGVQVVGNVAYVADYSAGLQILDVSNPQAVIRLGGYNTPGSAYGVQVVDDVAYVADGSAGLQILDVSNPAAVTHLGGYDTVGDAREVQIVGNVAYVADLTAGLQILDVSNPDTVTSLGSYDTPGSAQRVQVVGGVAYVADGYSGLQILDVSNPAAVTQLNVYNTPGYAYGVQVMGSVAYVADRDSLEILDVSDPAAVTRLGGFGPPTNALDLYVAGSRVYVCDTTTGLQIVEVGSPAAGISHVSGNTYRVDLGTTLPEGDYALLLGPAILAAHGSAMDQDQDGTPQESSEDVYFARFAVDSAPPVVSRLSPADDSTWHAWDTQLVITFNEGVRKGAGNVVVKKTSDHSVVETIDVGSFKVIVSGATAIIDSPATLAGNTGYYVEVDGGAFEDIAGNAFAGISGALAWNFVTSASLALAVNATSPDLSGPVPPLSTIDVTFNKPIDPASFSGQDVALLDPGNLNFAALGSYGGSLYDCVVEGSLLYASTGSGLRILDVSNPAAVTSLGAYEALNSPAGLQVVNNVAYVTDGATGLWILDVSNPAAITRLGGYDTSGSASKVHVAGGVAYVADGSAGLQILNVSDPALVVRLGGYDTPGTAYGVQVVGGVAYVADYAAGLVILDVSDPETVTLLGAYDTPGGARNVQVVGSVAYVADNWGGLQILDVSNPGAVTQLGGYDTTGYSYDIQVVGSVAYLADYAAGLVILDVSHPAAVTLLGQYNTPGYARGVQVLGSTAYVADDLAGLQIFDVSSPASVTPVSTYGGSVLDVQAVGNVVYVWTYSTGVQILDVSDPDAVTRLGGCAEAGRVGSIQVAGDLLYSADGSLGLQIFDVSDPTAVTRLGGYDTPGSASDVDVVGDVAYVADWSSGLQILDVSDPRAVTFLGEYDTPGTALDVQVVNGVAYVIVDYYGLQILDVSNPASVRPLGMYRANYVSTVEVVGNVAYVLGNYPLLRILDISNPAAVTSLGSYGTAAYIRAIEVVDKLAYVTAEYAGLEILDVSNPAAVVRLGGLDTPGNAYGLSVSGRMAYVASDRAGLQIVEVGSAAAHISHVSGNTYRVDLGQTLPEGDYVLLLGGGILDLDGRPLDQDRDGILGEESQDAYVAHIEVVAFKDFGDAPTPYPTRWGENGARHVATGPTLGAERDVDFDGFHSPLASYDDTNGTATDDEDGVTFGPIRVGRLGASVTVNVQNAPGGAKLDAWIDFNADGSWGGPFEQIAHSVTVVNGDNIIAFDVPSWATPAATYARFRLSTAGGLGVGGEAIDGEVEDYHVALASPVPSHGGVEKRHLISTNANWAIAAFAADIDGDGDIDAVSASRDDDKIAWYENLGTGAFTEHVISTTADLGTSVFAADLDGDGDTDVVSASYNDDKIAWYQNNGSGTFTTHVISTAADGAQWVFVADMDGDGDMDVLSASRLDDKIAWYENDGWQNFTPHTITTTADGAFSVFAADLNGDGHLDVLSASAADDKIAWYQNDGRQGFAERVISSHADGAQSVFAADVDVDGDIDVLSASRDDNKISWYENDGAGNFTEHVLSITAIFARSVLAADMDGDGDVDILAASANDNKIAWYENLGNRNFIEHIVTLEAANPRTIFAADMDGDGDLDILAAEADANAIAWYENEGLEYGDAPAPYPTTHAADGARHKAAGPTLGPARDAESDGRPSALADGDDSHGSPDDEDGVTFLTPLARGLTAQVNIDATSAAVSSYLNAWIDFNRNGSWADPGERIASDLVVPGGSNLVLFVPVPVDAASGLTFARFRLSTVDSVTGGYSFTGAAPDGEVEDYAVTIPDEVHLVGTGDADVVHFSTSAAGHTVTINGAPVLVVASQVFFDGLAGNDTITILGSDENEIVTLQPGSADVVGQTWQVHAVSVENVIVSAAGGADQVTMIGSAGSNRLYSYSGYTLLSDSPRTFSYRASGFDSLTVSAPAGGRNYAFLYDSPQNDTLDANPGRVILNRAVGAAGATTTTATGFQRVYAYATQDGTDAATLAASADTAARFYSYADYAILTDSASSFYFYASSFDTVTANSSGTGCNYAYLYDSPEVDQLTAGPASASMVRAAPWSDVTAAGFNRLYAYSTRGGSDTAQLAGSATGGNRYYGYPTYSTLTDAISSFYHYASGFRSVTATGSATDTVGDRAFLYDSLRDDTLYGRGNWGYLEDTAASAYHNEVWYFDYLYARSTDDDTVTNDTVDVADLAYCLLKYGTW